MKDITHYIDIEKLTAPVNNLETIILLSTGKEEQALKDHFIDQVIINTNEEDTDKAKNIDFYIYTNKNKPNKFNTTYLEKIFKSVTYKFLSVPNNKDFYFHPHQVKNLTEAQLKFYDFTHGQKSGPNYSFFRILHDLKEYNTSLMLESDCFLKPGWINDTWNYTKHCNGFWVSGAKYSGAARCDTDPLELLTKHINGGVCLYATGDYHFQQFIKLMENFLIDVMEDFPAYPYDYIIPMMIWAYVNSEDTNYYQLGRYIEKYYCFNNLISNLSVELDSSLDPEEIFRLYKYKMLHKKPFSYKKFTK